MKPFRIRLTPEAGRLIYKLHPENKKLIKVSLKELRKNPHLGDELQEELFGFRSYKPKRYRIIYKIDEDERAVLVYHVDHRRDIYERFKSLLNKLASQQ